MSEKFKIWGIGGGSGPIMTHRSWEPRVNLRRNIESLGISILYFETDPSPSNSCLRYTMPNSNIRHPNCDPMIEASTREGLCGVKTSEVDQSSVLQCRVLESILSPWNVHVKGVLETISGVVCAKMSVVSYNEWLIRSFVSCMTLYIEHIEHIEQLWILDFRQYVFSLRVHHSY